MRLARVERPRAGTGLKVGDVPPALPQPAADAVQSFRAFHRELQAPAQDFAEQFVGRDDALDAVQNAVFALWRQWETLPERKRTLRYALGIVRHHAWALRRENSRYVSLDEAEDELDRLAVSAVREGSRGGPRGDLLDVVIAAMTPRRREVFLLVREQGYTYPEAAEILGLSIGTINTYMHAANEEVRQAFDSAGYQVAPPQTRALPSPKGGDTND